MHVLRSVILPDHFKFASYGPALYVVIFTCQHHSSLLAYTLDRRISSLNFDMSDLTLAPCFQEGLLKRKDVQKTKVLDAYNWGSLTLAPH